MLGAVDLLGDVKNEREGLDILLYCVGCERPPRRLLVALVGSSGSRKDTGSPRANSKLVSLVWRHCVLIMTEDP